jgi:UDP-glucose 4-epimerase
MTKSKSAIEHINYEKAYDKGFEDMRRREPDITKLKKISHYTPKVGIDEMLSRVINYYRK